MKTITATQLKNSPSDLFDALLSEGEVKLTRNGKEFPLKLVREHVENENQDTGAKRIVSAFAKLAESIPAEKREEVHDDMMAELKSYRENLK